MITIQRQRPQFGYMKFWDSQGVSGTNMPLLTYEISNNTAEYGLGDVILVGQEAPVATGVGEIAALCRDLKGMHPDIFKTDNLVREAFLDRLLGIIRIYASLWRVDNGLYRKKLLNGTRKQNKQTGKFGRLFEKVQTDFKGEGETVTLTIKRPSERVRRKKARPEYVPKGTQYQLPV